MLTDVFGTGLFVTIWSLGDLEIDEPVETISSVPSRTLDLVKHSQYWFLSLGAYPDRFSDPR